MEQWGALDSRDYIVAFELESLEHCPPDFQLSTALAGFDTGLFLPRDDPDWFGRSSYPPRVLLLKSGVLHIVPHPSTGKPSAEFEIGRLTSIESGHMLLKGWLRFTGCGFDHTLRYNTRGFPSVFAFMRRFREMWLNAAGSPETPAARLGASLDIKFNNCLERDLDSGECIAAQFFQAPMEVKSNRWLIPRRRWLPGDLLVLTGRRLIWITDRDRGSISRYGSITSYSPLHNVQVVELIAGLGGHILRVELPGDSRWRIPIGPENVQHASDFATAVSIRKGRNRVALSGELHHDIDT
jgi:hypothetical protein